MTEDILTGSHAIMMQDEIPFEETVQGSGYILSTTCRPSVECHGYLHRTNHRIANLSAIRRVGRARLTSVRAIPRRAAEATLAIVRSVRTDASLGEYPAM